MCSRLVQCTNTFALYVVCGSAHDLGGPQFHNRKSHRPPRGRTYSEHVHRRPRGAPTGFGPGSAGRFVDEGDVNMNSGQDGAFHWRL